jgi:hypothetical protein
MESVTETVADAPEVLDPNLDHDGEHRAFWGRLGELHRRIEDQERADSKARHQLALGLLAVAVAALRVGFRLVRDAGTGT